MKEDILEQLVDDYLQSEGYFTRHNIKFKPRSDHPEFETRMDSNHSDIDVLGYNPKKPASERVVVVSCKSWQRGFNVNSWLSNLAENKIISGRESWQAFRELVKPKWAEALIAAVEDITGTRKFTYTLAVTAIVGDRSKWEKNPSFCSILKGNPLKVIELSEMLDRIESMSTSTVAASQIGRIIQLMKAARKGKQQLLKAVEAQSNDED